MTALMMTTDELTAVAERLLKAGGLSDDDAKTIAADLVAANLRGLDSHGVSRIPMYLERIRRGVVKPQPDIKVYRITSGVAMVDGDDSHCKRQNTNCSNPWEEIPLGLAIDNEGEPTTDTAKAFEGVCLPFGGAKCAALAMMMDLLAGVLTGANYGGDVKSLYFDHSEPQNVGHLFITIKPNLFISKEEFENRMDTFVSRVKSLPKEQGFDDILIPGEPEELKTEERMKSGIPLTVEVKTSPIAEAELQGIDISDILN